LCNLGEGNDSQHEATVKNGQKSTHRTNPSTNRDSACSLLGVEDKASASHSPNANLSITMMKD